MDFESSSAFHFVRGMDWQHSDKPLGKSLESAKIFLCRRILNPLTKLFRLLMRVDVGIRETA
jgi:hypothetical protein